MNKVRDEAKRTYLHVSEPLLVSRLCVQFVSVQDGHLLKQVGKTLPTVENVQPPVDKLTNNSQFIMDFCINRTMIMAFFT